jgi:type IV fimbrial biogenesis protein FimT
MTPLRLFQLSLKSKGKGFTLIEVMVSLAILGILAALAAPSFSESIKRYRVNAVKDDLIASIQVARSEAIRSGFPVILERQTVGCTADTSVNNVWSCGWRMFVDFNSNGVQDVAAVPPEPTLQVATVSAGYGVIFSSLTTQLVFDRWGQLQNGNRNFVVSPPEGNTGTSTKTICMQFGGKVSTVKGATCS